MRLVNQRGGENEEIGCEIQGLGRDQSLEKIGEEGGEQVAGKGRKL